jgi:hypothetical protein
MNNSVNLQLNAPLVVVVPVLISVGLLFLVLSFLLFDLYYVILYIPIWIFNFIL